MNERTRDWPRARLQDGLSSWFGVVAAVTDARAAGRALRMHHLRATGRGHVDVRQLAHQAGIHVEAQHLDAPSGGLQALLIPMLRGGFTIEVDPRPAPPEAGVRRATLVRSRVAHELAHVLFYKPGAPPTRPDRPNDDEERICDEFASALLVPGQLLRSTATATARAADVTLELAEIARQRAA